MREQLVLALMARKKGAEGNRLAGEIEDKESALALLEEIDSAASDRLFVVDEKRVSLDQLEEHVLAWDS